VPLPLGNPARIPISPSGRWYYLDNKTYLAREQRYGTVVPFNNEGAANPGLDDILQAARMIHDAAGKLVVIPLGYRLDSPAVVGVLPKSYVWRLTVIQAGLRSFQTATSLLRRLEPATIDEGFDAYLLK
jgi:hypothetical protein